MMVRSICVTLVLCILCSCSKRPEYASEKVLAYGASPAAAIPASVPVQSGNSVGSAVRSFPKGVVISDRTATKKIDGLYPGVGEADATCCWLSAEANLLIERTGVGRNVRATIFVPYQPLFQRKPERLTLSVGGQEHTFGDLGPGIHTLSFVLDPKTKPGRFRMKVTGRGWSPATEGINEDSRILSVILNQVVVN